MGRAPAALEPTVSAPARLSGRTIATTRDGSADDPLTLALAKEGASVVTWPTVAFRPPSDPEALDAARAGLERYDWLVFTSARAVESLLSDRAGAVRDREGSSDAGLPRIAVVGLATAVAVEAAGWTPVLVGPGSGADALATALVDGYAMEGATVLFPAASRAGGALESRLRTAGAEVTRVEAYRTLSTPPDPQTVADDLDRGVEAILFASPSAVRGLMRAFDGRAQAPGHGTTIFAAALGATPCVAIGPTTTRALHEVGIPDPVVAPDPSLEGLVDASARLTTRT